VPFDWGMLQSYEPTDIRFPKILLDLPFARERSNGNRSTTPDQSETVSVWRVSFRHTIVQRSAVRCSRFLGPGDLD